MGSSGGIPSMTGPVRAVVIDDATVVRAALAQQLPEINFVGSYPTIEQMIDESPAVDLVILDHQLTPATGERVLQGPAGIRALLEHGYNQICIYSQEQRPLPLALCIVAGAKGLARKSDPLLVSQEQFIRVAHGETVITDSFPSLAEFLDRRSKVKDLTEIQRQVLHYRARNIAWATIGRRLGINPKTAEDHLKAVDAKIGNYLQELGLDPARTPSDIERALGITPDDRME